MDNIRKRWTNSESSVAFDCFHIAPRCARADEPIMLFWRFPHGRLLMSAEASRCTSQRPASRSFRAGAQETSKARAQSEQIAFHRLKLRTSPISASFTMQVFNIDALTPAGLGPTNRAHQFSQLQSSRWGAAARAVPSDFEATEPAELAGLLAGMSITHRKFRKTLFLLSRLLLSTT